MKIWVDTDIGSEIDDALALAYLLSKRAVDIVGISVITEQSQTRAMLASAICSAAGRPDIPIYLGCEESLEAKPFGQIVSQAAALQLLEHRRQFEGSSAVERLRETIYSSSNEVILLGLGPLSNLAQLFVSDSEIPQRLRRLVTMCGNFSDRAEGTEAIEWNARLDPKAADIVFRTRVAGGHYLVGLETTRCLSLPFEVLGARDLPPVLDAVRKLYRAKNDPGRPLTMYDTAAAIIAINPDSYAIERGTATVDLKYERGTTAWQSDHSGSHLCVKAMSSKTIHHEFLSTFEVHRESC